MANDNYYETIELLRVILGTYGRDITIEDAVKMVKYVQEELGTPPNISDVPF